MSYIDYIKNNIKDGSIVHIGGYDLNSIHQYYELSNTLDREFVIIGGFQGVYGQTSKDIGGIKSTKHTIPTADEFKKQYPKAIIHKSSQANVINCIKECPALIYLDMITHLPTKVILNGLLDMIRNGVLLVTEYSDRTYGPDTAVKQFIVDNKLNSINVSDKIIITNIQQLSKPQTITAYDGEEIIIATVLKSGGVYTREYANNLAYGIKNNVTLPHKLVCITDLNPDEFSDHFDEIIPFSHDWPKWWGKIELFKRDFFPQKRILYFDLDTIITNNIDDFVRYTGPFAALSDFYTKTSIGSGVMLWKSGDYCEIYDTFKANSQKYMNECPMGDQQWIGRFIKVPKFIQSIFPNKAISFKVHCIKKKSYNKNDSIDIPSDSAVLCFHGEPRIHNIENEIIRDKWSAPKNIDFTTKKYTGVGIEFGTVNSDIHYDNVIIIGSGSSLENFDFNVLQDLPSTFIITVNGSGQYVPFANAWFTLDPWGLTTTQIPNNFKGIKYAAVPDDYGTKLARLQSHQVKANNSVIYLHRLIGNNYTNKSSIHSYKLGLSDDPSCISTGNSGYGALNVAYHMKPNNIILLGIDAGDGYFYTSQKSNGPLNLLPTLFESAIPQLNKHNIIVYNGSEISKVDCFPKYNPTQLIEFLKTKQI